MSAALAVEPLSEIDNLLDAWQDGNPDALNQIMPMVIDDVYQMAQSRFGGERKNHTLQPTALVNELYLRLVNQKEAPKNRLHFYATAAVTIKRILIDHARRKTAKKKGQQVDWPEHEFLFATDAEALLADDMLALDQALGHLTKTDPELGKIVHLRFFLGMTYGEIAELVGRSQKWVRKRWELARAMLLMNLSEEVLEP